MPEEQETAADSDKTERQHRTGCVQMLAGFVAAAMAIYVGMGMNVPGAARNWSARVGFGSLIVALLLHRVGGWWAAVVGKKSGAKDKGYRVAIWMALAVLLVLGWLIASFLGRMGWYA